MKLHELHINDFKFFSEVDPDSPLLKINGKHVLIYGENGSGKSTIYWALYTLLECSLKEDDNQVRKYFKKIGKDSLVNIHATGRNNSHIKVVLRDGAGAEKNYKVSRKSRDLRIRGNSDVQESNMASDFINYRVLFQLHNLKHSKDNDLFQWFLDEVLPYVKIGNDPCLDEYNELLEGPAKYRNIYGDDVYPLASLRTHADPGEKAHYSDYLAFKRRVIAWSNWLKSFLETIMNTANNTISTDFGYDLKLKFDFTKFDFTITEDDFDPKPPEIRIKIIEYEGIINPKIDKPHTFLNEAKWSAIGMSLRLAILDTKLFAADLKCLVIDDMLLSLDMGNRDVVLDILLNRYATDYQLIMMTHDKYFYELAQYKIHQLRQTDWKFLEMFSVDDSSGKAKPLILETDNKIKKAWSLFHSRELDLCANTVRKAAEKLCKAYLTHHERLNTDYTQKKLHDMLVALRTKGIANGLDQPTLDRLIEYKDRILNPNSHYDISTPLFETELKKAIEAFQKIATDTGINV